MTAPVIDLDAARRETRYPNGIEVKTHGKTFTLPPELPEAVLDPLLADDLDLAGLLTDILAERKDDSDQSIADDIVDILSNRPRLPAELVRAIRECFAVLFGEQYAEFKATVPSIPDYIRIARQALPLYGVSLGEALGSPGPSESGGETSNPTSPASTPESTPATSSETPTTPAT